MNDNCGSYKKPCLKYSNCISCTKTGICATYQTHKKDLSPQKTIFEQKISTPEKFNEPTIL